MDGQQPFAYNGTPQPNAQYAMPQYAQQPQQQGQQAQYVTPQQHTSPYPSTPLPQAVMYNQAPMQSPYMQAPPYMAQQTHMQVRSSQQHFQALAHQVPPSLQTPGQQHAAHPGTPAPAPPESASQMSEFDFSKLMLSAPEDSSTSTTTTKTVDTKSSNKTSSFSKTDSKATTDINAASSRVTDKNILVALKLYDPCGPRGRWYKVGEHYLCGSGLHCFLQADIYQALYLKVPNLEIIHTALATSDTVLHPPAIDLDQRMHKVHQSFVESSMGHCDKCGGDGKGATAKSGRRVIASLRDELCGGDELFDDEVFYAGRRLLGGPAFHPGPGFFF